MLTVHIKKIWFSILFILLMLLIGKYFIWDIIIQGEDGFLREQNILPVRYADYIDRELDYTWARQNTLIAHALGGINTATYTNSKEAFIKNYKKGHRVFEVDLIFTSDGHLVCKHDWDRFMST